MNESVQHDSLYEVYDNDFQIIIYSQLRNVPLVWNTLSAPQSVREHAPLSTTSCQQTAQVNATLAANVPQEHT